jgi:hypothetical protein
MKRTGRLALGLAALMVLGPDAFAAKQKVAVTDIQTVQGVTEGTATILMNIVVAEIGGLGPYDVISKADITSMIGFEKQKQLLGCTDNTSCLSEIGGALGVTFMVSGQVGKIGTRYHITLSLVDPTKAKVVAREARFSEQTEDALVETAQSMVKALFGKLVPAGSPAVAALPAKDATTAAAKPSEEVKTKSGSSNVVAYVALGVGAALLAGAAIKGLETQSAYKQLAALPNLKTMSQQEFKQKKAAVTGPAHLADGLMAGGVVAAGVGAFLLLRSPAPTEGAMLVPAGSTHSVGLAAAGRF